MCDPGNNLKKKLNFFYLDILVNMLNLNFYRANYI